eukprot:603923-Rhodomonas_salina.2
MDNYAVCGTEIAYAAVWCAQLIRKKTNRRSVGLYSGHYPPTRMILPTVVLTETAYGYTHSGRGTV